MQNKLQELTDRLYAEGLSKGKEEGEQILANAKAEAAAIVEKAHKEADAILAKAEKDAEDLKSKVSSDIQMAASQSLQATRKDIENLVIAKFTDANVDNILSSAEFTKEIIKTVAEKFSATEACDLSLVLPASLQEDLEPFVQNELAKCVKGTVEAKFSKKVAGGFTIAPKDGSYFISLTDEAFKALIGEYLRPVTKKVLFG